MKIHSVVTVSPHRLRKCSLLSDKEMKTPGRGTQQPIVTIVDDVEIRITKWYDNKTVHLLSTFASANPTKEIQCWDKKSKNIIQCPNIVLAT